MSTDHTVYRAHEWVLELKKLTAASIVVAHCPRCGANQYVGARTLTTNCEPPEPLTYEP